jgi:sugar lactone lactonase YvrE
VTTYKPDGTRTTPTITGLSQPYGVAVDARGKIYVASAAGGPMNFGEVTTYTANGKRASPTITMGMHSPYGVAVDAAGKIYVTTQNGVRLDGTLTTYTAKGSLSTPTITGLNFPFGVAVH